MTDQEKIDLYIKNYGDPNDPNNPNNLPSVSCFGLIVSFLIPIVGVVCYFSQRDRVSSPNSYLYAAFVGFIINLLLLSITERI